jgi:hypothetical protein
MLVEIMKRKDSGLGAIVGIGLSLAGALTLAGCSGNAVGEGYSPRQEYSAPDKRNGENYLKRRQIELEDGPLSGLGLG